MGQHDLPQITQQEDATHYIVQQTKLEGCCFIGSLASSFFF
jgi:hypothetical protein